MHVALARNKTRLDSARNAEDKLTSMFFGTLQYLPASAIAFVFDSLLYPFKTCNAIADFLKFIQTDEVEFDFIFWPNLLKSGRIEPDLLIVATNKVSKLSRTLLIECKWESSESSSNQLAKQWDAIPDKMNTLHIYLVKKKSEGHQIRTKNLSNCSDCIDRVIWEERLHVMSWHDVMNAISCRLVIDNNKRVSRCFDIWSRDLCGAFNRIGISVFNGFHKLSFYEIPHFMEKTLYWKAFSGFADFNEKVEDLPSTFVFWNKHSGEA